MQHSTDIQFILNFFSILKRPGVIPRIDNRNINDYLVRYGDIEFGVDLIKLTHSNLEEAFKSDYQKSYAILLSDQLKNLFLKDKKHIGIISITMKSSGELEERKIKEIANKIYDFIIAKFPTWFSKFKWEGVHDKMNNLSNYVLSIIIDNSPYVVRNRIDIMFDRDETYDLSTELNNLIHTKQSVLKHHYGNTNNSLLLILAENVSGKFQNLLIKFASRFRHKSSYKLVYLFDPYSQIYFQLNT